MTSKADELLQDLGEEELDLDAYDPDMVDDILNEEEEEMPEVLKVDPLKFIQLPRSSFSQRTMSGSIEDSYDEKLQLESLLQNDPIEPIQQNIEVVDPLDLIHKKELEDAITTDKTFSKTLDLKRQYTKSKLPVIRFDEINEISGKLISAAGYNPGLPTSLAASRSYIVIGTSYGNMMSFNHEGTELKPMKTKSKAFGSVTCIDISPNEQWVISGYQLGQVALWDPITGNCIKASNTVHSSAVLSIKFWHPHKCCVISSDANGKVMLSEYAVSFMSITLNTKILISGNNGICISLEPLFPYEKWPHPCDSALMTAIGSTESVQIYSLEPELKCLFEYSKPNNVQLGVFPCLTWKLAQAPDDSQPIDPILALGWDKRVTLFRFKFAAREGVHIAGYLDIENEIKSLLWLSTDILSIMDLSRELRVVTSKGFMKKPNDDANNAILDITWANRDIATQSLIKDEAGKEKTTFYNSVKAYERVIYLLGFKQFHKGRLLNWKECVDTLIEKGEWLEVLSLGMNLYQKKGQKLYGVPERKDDLREVLEAVILDYVKFGKLAWHAKISHAIEFCIGIESLELLFNELYDYFIDVGSGTENLGYFMDTLEPFILNGEIKGIPNTILGKIVAYYLNIHRPDIIERLILHLDPTCLDPKQLIPVCEEYNLLTGYIFINTNSVLQSYVNPLKRIYKALTKQEDPKSRRYFAYKLMWYYRLCIKGETFPSGRIHPDLMQKVINSIVEWLLKRKHLATLLDIDSSAILKLIWLLFEERLPYQILQANKDEESKPTHKKILDKLEQNCKPETYAFHQFTVFIAKASSVNQEIISKAICLKTAKYLMEPTQLRLNNFSFAGGSTIESFLAHNPFDGTEFSTTFDLSIEEKGQLILKMLKNCKDLSEGEINELFKISSKSPYTEVLVYLLELKKDYTGCVNSFVRAENVEIKKKIFAWLDEIFEKLSSTEFETIKAMVMDYLNLLVDIDSDRTAKIVRDWFHNEHSSIIDKLDNAPQLQMKYLGELIKNSSSDIDENLILRYIRLLCINSPGQVLDFLKSRDDYSLDECLEICKKYQINNATAYIYERLGSIKDALDLMLDIITIKRSDLFGRILSRSPISNTLINELKPEISNAVSLCIRSADDQSENEEHWFQLLTGVLTTYKQFSPYFTNYLSLEPMVQWCIKQVLESMMDNVDFNKIISHIVNNFGDIPFRYFKENIVSILSQYSYQKNIVRKAIDLLHADLKNTTQEMLVLRNKGVSSKEFKCSFCQLTIDSDSMLKGHDDKMFIFICGHSYHGRCAKEKICKACEKDNIRKGNFMLASRSHKERKGK
ncbi:unnamed protein product [Blepharisma stoltei]|uniref:Vacuolar protein sorting-associated protein 8 central domain-containing protein n=1 Tax=Blepharisma stoltei TaxID=1481888 RepID=A0AAU9I9U5_9CILI|nr:unnamed protein product [Blepharisma stoltei]